MNDLIMNREQLYQIIMKYCNTEKYSIGFHAIDFNKFNRIDKNDKIALKKRAEEIKKDIENNGLLIKSSRTLLGTVRFFDENEEKSYIENYTYGVITEYAIIAIPKILKSKSGNEIFLGQPNYKSIYYNYMGNQGYQITSLSEAILPNYQYNNSFLPPFFTFATFSILDDGNIKLSINKDHICFHNDLVDDNIYSKKIEKLNNSLNYYGIETQFNSKMSIDEIKELHTTISYIINNIDFYSSSLNLNLLPDNIQKVCINILENIKNNSKLDAFNINDENLLISLYAIDETLIQLAKKYYNLNLIENNNLYKK